MSRSRLPLAFLCLSLLTVGCERPPSETAAVPTTPSGDPGGAYTYSRDIAPIIYEHCLVCHRDGQSAPFVLRTYDDVRRRANQIVTVTDSGYMPPWLPGPDSAPFDEERLLTPEQLSMLRDWVDQGAIEGDAADLPDMPDFPEGWQLGEPDLVIRMTEPFTVPADGPDVFRNFVIPIPIEDLAYIRGVEFRPDTAQVVHHAVMFVDHTGTSRRLDAMDSEPGFGGMEVGRAENPDGHFLGWTPGKAPYECENDVAWRLDRGTDMVLQLHLQPTGRVETIQASIGLFFAETPPTRRLFHVSLRDDAINIDPGDAAYVVEDSYVLPTDVEVRSLYPHAHYLGRDLRIFATLPSGETEPLIHIPDWDFNWQDQYRLKTPLALPGGTTLTMRYTFDNSAANVRNPNSPPQRVLFGNESTDEMATAGIQVLPRTPLGRTVLAAHKLEHDVAKRIADFERLLAIAPDHLYVRTELGVAYRQAGQLDKAAEHLGEVLRLDPNNAAGHNHMGVVWHLRERYDAALAAYRTSLSIQPNDAETHYNLANTLQQTGDAHRAITHFREAIRLDPDHASAHFNLGVAFDTIGSRAEAAREYETVISLKPDHAKAYYNLGLYHGMRGDTDRALTYFQESVNADPSFAPAHNNLGVSLEMTGRLDEAIEQYREAVRLRPDYADARRRLQNALQKAGRP